ncbi:hypothetical protein GCM10009844_06970 [Nocardioides koreensis]|uniref:WD40 repeat domain-containing protein n=1 Tax=Nocardioides koreensis TaxID=433651 RepID=A0ABP5KXA7_9ACTN
MAFPGPPRHLLRIVLAAACAASGALLTWLPAEAAPAGIDPAALPRGDDPAVAHLVRDTIRDGDARIPATTRGRHEALWVVDGGYVVRDYNVGPKRLIRITFINSTGERREVARSHDWIEVAVSEDGARLAFRRSLGPTGQRSVITVEDAADGTVVATRELRLANLVAVTGTRVLVGRRFHWHHPATQWWSYGRDRLRKIADQAAVGADIRHDKVVLGTPSAGEFCNRVAVLSHPRRTLWRSCRIYPHQWSPDGTRALATHTYFDAAGTDRWWVVDGRTAARQARITGRLDWNAVWEDDGHFLTLAQSDAGRAAVIRCDVTGECERASRLWRVPLPSEPSLYYAAPPVVLADR